MAITPTCPFDVEVHVKSDPVPTSGGALARVNQSRGIWDDFRLQKLWLAVQRKRWRSLALVSTSASIDTTVIAGLLAELVWRYRGEPSVVCDLRDLSMRLIEHQLREVRAEVESGARVLIALRSIFETPAAAPVARESDAVVLCIGLGDTEFKAAELTINEIGRDRILGAIVVKAPVAKRPEVAV